MTIQDLTQWLDRLSGRLKELEDSAGKCRELAVNTENLLAVELSLGFIISEITTIRQEVDRMKGTP